MLAEANAQAATKAAPTAVMLNGVHHSARPTWKLKETVEFYRDTMGLALCHAICARGWGPDDHPDFIHFFFDSGRGSTIAFFYYLTIDKPEDSSPQGGYLHNSVHTAWRVETREELLAWKTRLEGKGLDVMQVRHEILESIYVTDPNGYSVEIALELRPMSRVDATDAALTLAAAIGLEEESSMRVETIDEIWQRKAELVDAYLADAN